MAGPADLFDACAEWLAVCAAAVATAEGGAIDRTYVAPVPPDFDCEQLTVHAGGPAEGDTAPLSPPLAPGHRAEQTGAVHLVNLTATVLRCLPIEEDGEPSDESVLEEVARATLGDVWAIWNHTRRRKQDGSLFPPGSRELFLDPAFPVNASGGFGGWQLSIRVALPGYSLS